MKPGFGVSGSDTFGYPFSDCNNLIVLNHESINHVHIVPVFEEYIKTYNNIVAVFKCRPATGTIEDRMAKRTVNEIQLQLMDEMMSSNGVCEAVTGISDDRIFTPSQSFYK